MDLVWIVLSCQAIQGERPDSLTQSKPNPHMVLLHSAQHFLSDGGMHQLNFQLPAPNIKTLISLNSRLMWLLSKTNLSRANSNWIPSDKTANIGLQNNS